jgi:DnaK suppressor protein
MTARTDIDIDAMRKRLLDRREELLALGQSSADARKTVELDQTRTGRLSRMDALQGQAMAQATQRRREIELRRIEAALHRIEQDEYGYCGKCGEEITPKRLELDPTTPLCIDCAKSA